MPDPTARYAAHLTAYLEGRTEEAVAGLAAFDDAEVRAISTGRNPVAPVRLPSSGISRQRMLHAVAMLHAECAFALFRHGQHALADRHLTLAGRTVDTPGFGDSGPESFRCRWHLMVLMFANHDEHPRAAAMLEAAVSSFPDDSRILLEAAAKYQGDAMFSALVQARPADGGLEAARHARHLALEHARGLLERAVRVDASASEAQLRLAWVSSELGKLQDPTAAYEKAAAAGPPPVAYVAELALGERYETAARYDLAAAAYQRAVSQVPHSQVARTALAHALHRVGRFDTAAEVVHQGLASRTDDSNWDPWWQFTRSQLISFDELVSGLRRDVQK